MRFLLVRWRTRRWGAFLPASLPLLPLLSLSFPLHAASSLLVALSLTSSWSRGAGQLGEGSMTTTTSGVVAVPQVMFVVVVVGVGVSLTSSWSPSAGRMGEGSTTTTGVVAVPQVMFVMVGVGVMGVVVVVVGVVVVVCHSNSPTGGVR